MTGLIVKDICLLKQRKTTLILFLGISFFLSLSTDASFLISYISMVGVIMAASIISLDEYDNGYSFLMTLPIDAKTYVLEKYSFCSIALAGSWVLALVLQVISNTVQHVQGALKEMFVLDLIYIPIFLLILCFYIPVLIKFGAEKGRTAVLILMGIVFVVFTFGSKMLSGLGVDLSKTIVRLQGIPTPVVIVAAAVLLLLLIALSLTISIRAMQKKEF